MIGMTMSEAFYIIKVSEEWWQVRLVHNKECFGTHKSLEACLESIKRADNNYGTVEVLIEKWNNSDLVPSRNTTKDKNIKVYNEHGEDYRSEIEALFSNMTKVKLLPKRKNKLIKSASPEKIIPDRKEVIKEPIKKATLLKPKKKKLLIKS